MYESNYDMYIVPAVKCSKQISRGRGKGGLATLWRKSLTKYVSQEKCDNFRIHATKFSFPSGPILIINAYFPCDPQKNSFDNTELITLLSDIRNVIFQSKCSNVVLVGDLN